jgi:hypothetical protein
MKAAQPQQSPAQSTAAGRRETGARTRVLPPLLALVLAVLLPACRGVTDLDPGPAVAVEPRTVELTVGGRQTLTATVSHATDTRIIWRSAAASVAIVDDKGAVTAVGAGQAEIRAHLAADTMVYGTASVTVAPGSGLGLHLPVLGLGAVPERYTGEVAVRDDWAYTSTWSNRNGVPGNAIKIWNVAGTAPVLVDSLIVPGAQTTGDVQISDDGALLVVATEYAPGSIVLYDRSDPAHPRLLAQFRSAHTTPGVHTVKLGRVNGRHYAFLSVNPSPPRLVIVDITDPAAPVETWASEMGRPFVHDVFVRDGLVFAALWNDGMRILDIGGGGRGGSPAAPVVIGNALTATGRIHNIWWFHDPRTGSRRYVFLGEEGPGSVAAGSSSGDIHVVDVSDMTSPRVVAVYNVPGAGTHNFWMDEPSGILYAAYYNGGVRALDVRGDLGTCTTAQTRADGLCSLNLMGREVGIALTSGSFIWGVVHQGTHVYASDMRMGLFKIDVGRLGRE